MVFHAVDYLGQVVADISKGLGRHDRNCVARLTACPEAKISPQRLLSATHNTKAGGDPRDADLHRLLPCDYAGTTFASIGAVSTHWVPLSAYPAGAASLTCVLFVYSEPLSVNPVGGASFAEA